MAVGKPNKNYNDAVIQDAVAHTAHDSTDISHPTGYSQCNALYFGGAGDAVIVKPDATTVTFTVVAGSIIPIHAIRVNATSTTATAIVALY